MIIPVRCLTCSKVIGNKWGRYEKSLNAGINKHDALAIVGLRRYCCKRMFLGHVELIDKLILYSEKTDNSHDEKSATK
jgi:DNA-directed RNA polymerase I, II, and III subunit RPABC5